ncbi:MAG: hypothetical protein ACTSW1_13700 [Candidatus Hodarchaeales archaeon]
MTLLLAPLSARFSPTLFPFDYEQKNEKEELEKFISLIYEKLKSGEPIEEEVSDFFRKSMRSTIGPIFKYKKHPKFTVEGLIDYIMIFLQENSVDVDIINKLNENAHNTFNSFLELLCWIVKEDWERYSESAKKFPILHIITSYLKVLLEFIQYYDIFFTKLAYIGTLPKGFFFEIQDLLNNCKIWVRASLKLISVNSRVFVSVTRLSLRGSRKISKTRITNASSISHRINELYERVAQGLNLLSKLLWAYLAWNSNDYSEIRNVGFKGDFSKIPEQLILEITSEISELNNSKNNDFFLDDVLADTIDEFIKQTNDDSLRRDVGEIYYFLG